MVPGLRRSPIPPRAAETSRLETFADGVFAIAATLLIIDVSVNGSGAELGGGAQALLAERSLRSLVPDNRDLVGRPSRPHGGDRSRRPDPSLRHHRDARYGFAFARGDFQRVSNSDALCAYAVPPADVSQTGAARSSPSPSIALAGLPRTIVSHPRGSKSRPYSPGAKSA